MNKEIKKAGAILTEKETKRAAAISKARAELAEAREKLSAINSQIEKADGAEKFKELLSEKRDFEAVVTFCEKKLSEAEEALTSQEYNAIVRDVKAAFDTIQETEGKQILAEVEKLEELLQAYDNDITELNGILKRAAVLKRENTPQVLQGNSFGTKCPKITPYMKAFYDAKAEAETLRLLQGGIT